MTIMLRDFASFVILATVAFGTQLGLAQPTVEELVREAFHKDLEIRQHKDQLLSDGYLNNGDPKVLSIEWGQTGVGTSNTTYLVTQEFENPPTHVRGSIAISAIVIFHSTILNPPGVVSAVDKIDL